MKRPFPTLPKTAPASFSAGQPPPRLARRGVPALAAALLALLLVAGAAPLAHAGNEINEEGRRVGTDGKLTQSSLDGFPLEFGDRETRRPPGRQMTPAGRRARAVPTEDFSVGLVGCPGCTAILEAIGVWVDVDGGRGNLRRTRQPN